MLPVGEPPAHRLRSECAADRHVPWVIWFLAERDGLARYEVVGVGGVGDASALFVAWAVRSV